MVISVDPGATPGGDHSLYPLFPLCLCFVSLCICGSSYLFYNSSPLSFSVSLFILALQPLLAAGPYFSMDLQLFRLPDHDSGITVGVTFHVTSYGKAVRHSPNHLCLTLLALSDLYPNKLQSSTAFYVKFLGPISIRCARPKSANTNLPFLDAAVLPSPQRHMGEPHFRKNLSSFDIDIRRRTFAVSLADF